jgi:parallel beta-helix repeat protein
MKEKIVGLWVFLVVNLVAIEISSCQTLSTSGNYTLAQNVTTTGTCFEITASNITLDCKGFAIVGDSYGGGDIGINILANGTEIKNCEIKGFYEGVSISGNYSTLTSNKIHSNNGNGVYIYDSGHNTLTGNNIYSNNRGVYIYKSDHNTLTGNNIYSNNKGVYIYYWNSDHNTLTGNNIYSNNNEGVYISGRNNILMGNNIYSNIYDGVYISGYDNTLMGNNITKNYNGVSISGYDNTLMGNNIYSHNYGMRISGDDNTLMGNNIYSNNDAGVYISGDYNTLMGNNITKNYNGVSISGDYNTLMGNNIYSNKNYGVYISFGDPSDNLIYLNNFLWNDASSSNTLNNFDNGTVGNYWSSNKDCVDSDSNGICDSYYDCGPNCRDYYPLVDCYGPCPSKKKDGEPCNSSEECGSGNCKNSICCKAGEICCSSDAHCNQTEYCGEEFYCLDKKPSGDSCKDNSECLSNNCKNSICCEAGKICCSKDEHCPISNITGICDTSKHYCELKLPPTVNYTEEDGYLKLMNDSIVLLFPLPLNHPNLLSLKMYEKGDHYYVGFSHADFLSLGPDHAYLIFPKDVNYLYFCSEDDPEDCTGWEICNVCVKEGGKWRVPSFSSYTTRKIYAFNLTCEKIPPITCPEGYVLKCVPTNVTVIVTCPEGYKYNETSGKCEKPGLPVVTCPEGYEYNKTSGKCEKPGLPVVTCPEGYILERETCKKNGTVVYTCPNGTNLTDEGYCTKEGRMCPECKEPECNITKEACKDFCPKKKVPGFDLIIWILLGLLITRKNGRKSIT